MNLFRPWTLQPRWPRPDRLARTLNEPGGRLRCDVAEAAGLVRDAVRSALGVMARGAGLTTPFETQPRRRQTPYGDRDDDRWDGRAGSRSGGWAEDDDDDRLDRGCDSPPRSGPPR